MLKLNLFAHLLFAVLLIHGTTKASADGSSSNGGNSDFHTAITECAAAAGTDANGGPDRTKMDACMTSKGFTKPTGRGPGGPGGPDGSGGGEPPPGPPPSSSN